MMSYAILFALASGAVGNVRRGGGALLLPASLPLMSAFSLLAVAGAAGDVGRGGSSQSASSHVAPGALQPASRPASLPSCSLNNAPCGPTAAQLDTLALEPARMGSWKFYLHDEGVFNFRDLAECLLVSRNATWDDADDWDDRFAPSIGAYLTDVKILQLLQRHPRRTMVAEAADVHVIGGPLYAAYAAETQATWLEERKARGVKIEHHPSEACRASAIAAERSRKLAALATHLRSEPLFKAGAKWLVVSTEFHLPEALGPELYHTLLRNDQVVFGTADSDYWSLVSVLEQHNSPLTRSRLLVLPFKGTHWIDRLTPREVQVAERQEAAAAAAAAAESMSDGRNVSFFFAGTMDRKSEGAHRAVLRDVTAGIERAMVIERVINSTKRASDPNFPKRELMLATVAKYRQSHFCLVPAGDDPTSRRLFDALGAGCIPVLMAEFDKIARNLPFRSLIDWKSIAIFGGGLECTEHHVADTATWLRQLAAASQAGGAAGCTARDGQTLKLTPQHVVERMRARGQEAYQRFLSYARPGIVDALLGEMQATAQRAAAEGAAA